MIKLDDILVIFNKDIVRPTLGNDGWSIDIYSPSDFSLYEGNHIKLDSGFGLNLPHGIGCILSPKGNSPYHFSVSPGQIIHPSHKDEITINLKYEGRNEERIRAGDPICQLVLLNFVQVSQ